MTEGEVGARNDKGGKSGLAMTEGPALSVGRNASSVVVHPVE